MFSADVSNKQPQNTEMCQMKPKQNIPSNFSNKKHVVNTATYLAYKVTQEIWYGDDVGNIKNNSGIFSSLSESTHSLLCIYDIFHVPTAGSQ